MSMDRIELADTGRRTTQLGFGCAYLLPETAGLLEVAYDAGIRHFDVARAYGRGLTEGLLGKFLKRKDGDVTVTSKYGIRPPFSHPMHGAARALLRPLVRRLRRVPAMDRQITQSIRNDKAAFTAEEAKASLELSLRNLRRERIDLFLMHEASADDLKDEGLAVFLEDCVARGLIGGYGVGGDVSRADRLFRERPAFCRVMQFNWTALDPAADHEAAFSARYRVNSRENPAVAALLGADPQQIADWSARIDDDLAAPGRLQQLLLKAALELRPNDLILFSSTKPAHILANVTTWEDSRLAAPARRLVDLLLAHGPGSETGLS
jgi:D-threo-aldose 1-dehydrogenase